MGRGSEWTTASREIHSGDGYGKAYTDVKEKPRALGKGHFSLYLRGHTWLVLFRWNIAHKCKKVRNPLMHTRVLCCLRWW